jgi:Mor family transcriptional regulator
MCFRRAGGYPLPQNDKPPHRVDRNEAIRRRFSTGEAVADLAHEYGISVQRVHQILRS